MRNIAPLRLLPLIALLAACTGISEVPGIPGHTPFQNALQAEYDRLADKEIRIGDYQDADRYRERARLAGEGLWVGPEVLREWDLPDPETLDEARLRLIEILAGGGRDSAPILTARAQALFDCWVDEAEEGPDRVSVCAKRFAPTVRRASWIILASRFPRHLVEENMPPSPFGTHGMYVVGFDFDRSSVPDSEIRTFGTVLADMSRRVPRLILVTGHADAGSDQDYTRLLSAHRAEAVADQLARAGIPEDRIITLAFGDRLAPEEPTQSNRRVEILFVP